jgi:REase_MTES_1575
VISRSDALGTGLSMRAIYRVLESGEWLRLLPGVYALRGSPATFMRRVGAAYKWVGPGALISHSSSARLLDLDGVEPLGIEVSTPRRLRSTKVIVHQRATNSIPSLRIDGLRVARVEPTLLDLAHRLTPENLELAFDSALRMGLTRFDRLKRFYDSHTGLGVPGSRPLGELLRLREPCPRPHHSVLEVEFRQLGSSEDLPQAVSQFPIELRPRLTVHLDFAYPHEKLAIDIDSVRWHSGTRAIKLDNERQNLLVALGWRVLRFEWNDVIRRPQEVAAQLRNALALQQRLLEL